MYFDSHAHYDDRRFDTDRDLLLKNLLPEAGVTRVVNAGADMASSRAGIALSQKYSYVYASVGVHPHDAKNMGNGDLDTLLSLSEHPKVVAIGEIGLDFHYNYSEPDVQRKRFREQLELAKMANLPVIIHSREAAQETFDILKESGAAAQGGVIHCYSGSAEMALSYARMGFYIAFGGALTFPNARVTREAAAALPMEHILIETDCPYISPHPNRGKRNDSRNLTFINAKLSEIKKISAESAAKITWENGAKLFGKMDVHA